MLRSCGCKKVRDDRKKKGYPGLFSTFLIFRKSEDLLKTRSPITQTTFDIFHDINIVVRHLAANDVGAIVIGTANDPSIQHVVRCQCKVIDRDGKGLSLGIGKDRIAGQESKAIGTDVVQFAGIGLSAVSHGDRTGVAGINTRIFTAIVDAWATGNADAVIAVVVGIWIQTCLVPAIEDIADNDLNLATGNPMQAKDLACLNKESDRKSVV